MFPFVTVVQCPQEKMLEKIGPTLVCSAMTEDRKFQRGLAGRDAHRPAQHRPDPDDPAQLAAAARGQHRRFLVPCPRLPRSAKEIIRASRRPRMGHAGSFADIDGSRSPVRQFRGLVAHSISNRSTRVVFGAGTLARLGELARELGGTRASCWSPIRGWRPRAIRRRRLRRCAKRAWKYLSSTTSKQNPTIAPRRSWLAIARPHRIDFDRQRGRRQLDGLRQGNQLPLDQRRHDGRLHRASARRPGRCCPRSACRPPPGTGSEAQSYALIADEATHMKMACGDRKAAFRVAILDPEVTVSQPPRVTAITGIDALSHALESYVTTRRNPLAQMFAREAWRLLEPTSKSCCASPANLEARGAMQIGANFAGTAIENSMLGACHACANPLTAHYGITHGMAIGILLAARDPLQRPRGRPPLRRPGPPSRLVNGEAGAAAESWPSGSPT